MGILRKEVTAAALNSRIQGFLPGLLGVEIVEVEEGRLTGRMKITSTHLAPNGFFHAGGVVTLADTLCGCGAAAHLPDGAAGFTTVELKSNHLGTALEGTLFCVAEAQHLGRTTQVWDAVVTEENTGKKIALFRCTQMVLRPKK
ncbi:MAG: PaaI family thioesterase [Clostridiales Family XIII bacterium]|nr:PaaI family thioesterase [Clostridiales Family XIII bacterium]